MVFWMELSGNDGMVLSADDAFSDIFWQKLICWILAFFVTTNTEYHPGFSFGTLSKNELIGLLNIVNETHREKLHDKFNI